MPIWVIWRLHLINLHDVWRIGVAWEKTIIRPNWNCQMDDWIRLKNDLSQMIQEIDIKIYFLLMFYYVLHRNHQSSHHATFVIIHIPFPIIELIIHKPITEISNMKASLIESLSESFLLLPQPPQLRFHLPRFQLLILVAGHHDSTHAFHAVLLLRQDFQPALQPMFHLLIGLLLRLLLAALNCPLLSFSLLSDPPLGLFDLLGKCAFLVDEILLALSATVVAEMLLGLFMHSAELDQVKETLDQVDEDACLLFVVSFGVLGQLVDQKVQLSRANEGLLFLREPFQGKKSLIHGLMPISGVGDFSGQLVHLILKGFLLINQFPQLSIAGQHGSFQPVLPLVLLLDALLQLLNSSLQDRIADLQTFDLEAFAGRGFFVVLEDRLVLLRECGCVCEHVLKLLTSKHIPNCLTAIQLPCQLQVPSSNLVPLFLQESPLVGSSSEPVQLLPLEFSQHQLQVLYWMEAGSGIRRGLQNGAWLSPQEQQYDQQEEEKSPTSDEGQTGWVWSVGEGTESVEVVPSLYHSQCWVFQQESFFECDLQVLHLPYPLLGISHFLYLPISRQLRTGHLQGI